MTGTATAATTARRNLGALRSMTRQLTRPNGHEAGDLLALLSRQPRRRAASDPRRPSTGLPGVAVVGSTPVPAWMAERVAFALHLRNCVSPASTVAPRFDGEHKTGDVLAAANAIADVCKALKISLDDLHEASRAVLKPELPIAKTIAHPATNVAGSVDAYAMPRTA